MLSTRTPGHYEHNGECKQVRYPLYCLQLSFVRRQSRFGSQTMASILLENPPPDFMCGTLIVYYINNPTV